MKPCSSWPKHALWPGLACLAAVFGCGALWLSPGLAEAQTATPPAEASALMLPQPVISEIITPEGAQLRSFPGVIVAEVQSTLGFLTAGQIAQRPVRLGDLVAAGDILAVLDPLSLTNDREAAEAAARAAAARAALAVQTYLRIETLRRLDVVSQAQLEAATASRASAAAAKRAAEADVARARDAEGYGILRAPNSGVIVAVHAEPGASVAVGSPVVTLAQLDRREAVIDVPSDFLAILPADAVFRVTWRGLNHASETGRLRLIEPVADQGARSHRLRIRLDAGTSGAAQLRLGSLVTVALDQESEALLTLPIAALTPRQTVWRIGATRKLEEVAVSAGPRLGARLVVRDGIAAGDEILTRGIASVRAGQIVGERIAE